MELSSITTARTIGQSNYAPEPAGRASARNLSADTAAAPQKLGQTPKKPDSVILEQAVESANKVLASKTSNELHFAIDKDTGITVVKLTNRQSGETILQFPSEAMLQIAKGIDHATGSIIQRQA
nr:flagellar protein FlaG [uncultured Rhodoferax sp.]